MLRLKLPREVVVECRARLISTRQDIINRVRAAKADFDLTDRFGGDEIDQTVTQLAENSFLVAQERLRTHLLEIDYALSRIENGTYGFCEETDEPIETERLLAIPWTRLSIEGAEIREAMTKKYAKP